MNKRADHQGTHRAVYEKNRKIILASQNHCALCGRQIDKTLKYPHPLSASIDHITPLSKGGHPSALDNLQLVHTACNIKKSNKLPGEQGKEKFVDVNRELPLSIDWTKYRAREDNSEKLADEMKRIESTGVRLYADGIKKVDINGERF